MHTREQNSEMSNEKLASQFSHGLRNLFHFLSWFLTRNPVWRHLQQLNMFN